MNNMTVDQIRTDHLPINAATRGQSKTSLRNSIVLGIVGVFASLIASVAIQQTGRVFELPEDLLREKLSQGRNQTPDILKRFYEGRLLLDYKHAALWIGTAGTIVAVLYGLTLGMLRQSWASILAGAFGGLLAGCLFSTGAGIMANYLSENVLSPIRLEKTEVPLTYIMLLHGTTWFIIGLGIGLGTGLGATANRFAFAIRSMFICGIAGAAAGAFYPFFVSAVMPLVNPSLTVPEENLNRFVWIGLPVICIGFTLGRRVNPVGKSVQRGV